MIDFAFTSFAGLDWWSEDSLHLTLSRLLYIGPVVLSQSSLLYTTALPPLSAHYFRKPSSNVNHNDG
jgi:hypothetical protein